MDTMEISKNISYYLRHKPEEINIILDENGYVDLDLFLINMSKKMNLNIDEKVLNNILNKSDKKRFEINNGKIRAIHGHSIKDLDINYPEFAGDKTLYHATSKENLSSILKNGLKAQLRNYVHLSDDKESAKIVGLRHSSDIVVLEINTTDFLKDNFKIYDAKNGIYLAKEIPSKYIIIRE